MPRLIPFIFFGKVRADQQPDSRSIPSFSNAGDSRGNAAMQPRACLSRRVGAEATKS